MSDFSAGQIVEVPYPFVRDTYTDHSMDEEGWHATERPTWRPGTRCEEYSRADTDYVADGMGAQLLTVVSVHRPGKYPTRVFYTRQWRDPDGRVFGKKKLRIIAVSGFTSLTRGFRHEFDLPGDEAKRTSV